MEEGHQEKLGFCLGFSKEVAEDGRQGLRAQNRTSEPEVRVERRTNLPPTPLQRGKQGKRSSRRLRPRGISPALCASLLTPVFGGRLGFGEHPGYAG